MIIVNGEPRELAAGTTVDAVVAGLAAGTVGDSGGGGAGCGVAVAVNDEVVPRRAWPMTILGDGDRVEVLTAVQGG
ncbi:MAG TPA: sulfur carrier protein ThiS [Mycobacteriales bacterium]|nr:sulfur carrier protein ThiS [Mycobacteriales bacterium]